MKTEKTPLETKLTDANGLLAALWDEQSRPSLRWLRQQQRNRTIPYLKIGRLTFFDPEEVRCALAKRRVERVTRLNRNSLHSATPI
jgi:hypothetical protein